MEPITPVVEMGGRRFGALAVLARDESRKGGQAYWICRCDCGTTKSVNGSSLRRELSTNCGCLRKQATAKAKRTHGRTGSPEYKSWLAMRGRCHSPKHPIYHKYGERGITVCDRWYDSFEAFHEDMGDKPTPKHQIDRIDNSKGYEPGNCRWATASEQARNRTTTRMYTHDGTTLCVKDWCARLGLNEKTVRTRINQAGKTIGQALGLEE